MVECGVSAAARQRQAQRYVGAKGGSRRTRWRDSCVGALRSVATLFVAALAVVTLECDGATAVMRRFGSGKHGVRDTRRGGSCQCEGGGTKVVAARAILWLRFSLPRLLWSHLNVAARRCDNGKHGGKRDGGKAKTSTAQRRQREGHGRTRRVVDALLVAALAVVTLECGGVVARQWQARRWPRDVAARRSWPRSQCCGRALCRGWRRNQWWRMWRQRRPSQGAMA